jgi:acyl-CoA reductase-like NAD-dependent aldehyde dehydrogenase
VAAAKAAFKKGSEWRSMDPSARGELIRKLAGLIERDLAYLAVSSIPIKTKVYLRII